MKRNKESWDQYSRRFNLAVWEDEQLLKTSLERMRDNQEFKKLLLLPSKIWVYRCLAVASEADRSGSQRSFMLNDSELFPMKKLLYQLKKRSVSLGGPIVKFLGGSPANFLNPNATFPHIKSDKGRNQQEILPILKYEKSCIQQHMHDTPPMPYTCISAPLFRNVNTSSISDDFQNDISSTFKTVNDSQLDKSDSKKNQQDNHQIYGMQIAAYTSNLQSHLTHPAMISNSYNKEDTNLKSTTRNKSESFISRKSTLSGNMDTSSYFNNDISTQAAILADNLATPSTPPIQSQHVSATFPPLKSPSLNSLLPLPLSARASFSSLHLSNASSDCESTRDDAALPPPLVRASTMYSPTQSSCRLLSPLPPLRRRASTANSSRILIDPSDFVFSKNGGIFGLRDRTPPNKNTFYNNRVANSNNGELTQCCHNHQCASNYAIKHDKESSGSLVQQEDRNINLFNHENGETVSDWANTGHHHQFEFCHSNNSGNKDLTYPELQHPSFLESKYNDSCCNIQCSSATAFDQKTYSLYEKPPTNTGQTDTRPFWREPCRSRRLFSNSFNDSRGSSKLHTRHRPASLKSITTVSSQLEKRTGRRSPSIMPDNPPTIFHIDYPNLKQRRSSKYIVSQHQNNVSSNMKNENIEEINPNGNNTFQVDNLSMNDYARNDDVDFSSSNSRSAAILTGGADISSKSSQMNIFTSTHSPTQEENMFTTQQQQQQPSPSMITKGLNSENKAFIEEYDTILNLTTALIKSRSLNSGDLTKNENQNEVRDNNLYNKREHNNSVAINIYHPSTPVKNISGQCAMNSFSGSYCDQMNRNLNEYDNIISHNCNENNKKNKNLNINMLSAHRSNIAHNTLNQFNPPHSSESVIIENKNILDNKSFSTTTFIADSAVQSPLPTARSSLPNMMMTKPTLYSASSSQYRPSLACNDDGLICCVTVEPEILFLPYTPPPFPPISAVRGVAHKQLIIHFSKHIAPQCALIPVKFAKLGTKFLQWSVWMLTLFVVRTLNSWRREDERAIVGESILLLSIFGPVVITVICTFWVESDVFAP